MAFGMHPERDFYQQTVASTYNDFQRQYLFRVILPPFEGSDVDLDIITYFVSSTGTPQETTGVTTVPWQNSEIKVPGRTTYAEWNVTVKDSITSRVFQYFNNWRRLVYNRDTGESRQPRDFKQDIRLHLLGNTAEDNVEFRIRNAWPTTVGSSTLDYSSEGLMTFQVTFAFDDFETDKMIPS